MGYTSQTAISENGEVVIDQFEGTRFNGKTIVSGQDLPAGT